MANYKGYLFESATGNATSQAITGVETPDAIGTHYYWNDGGASALLELLHRAPDPLGAAPWTVFNVATALVDVSAEQQIVLPRGGQWASRVTIYSGGGNTGRVTNYLELFG